MVNTCTDDHHGQIFNNIYSRTYISKEAGKMCKPNFPSLTKFHQKLKKLAERVRSLEQPGKFLKFKFVYNTCFFEIHFRKINSFYNF